MMKCKKISQIKRFNQKKGILKVLMNLKNQNLILYLKMTHKIQIVVSNRVNNYQVLIHKNRNKFHSYKSKEYLAQKEVKKTIWYPKIQKMGIMLTSRNLIG